MPNRLVDKLRAVGNRLPTPLYHPARWLWQLTRRTLGDTTPRTFPGIPGPVHPHDGMLEDHGGEQVAHYRDVGLSALQNIDTAVRWERGRTILDLPCGYGCVLRWLRQHAPNARIIASDVDAAGCVLRAALRRGTLRLPA